MDDITYKYGLRFDSMALDWGGMSDDEKSTFMGLVFNEAASDRIRETEIEIHQEKSLEP